MPIPTHPRTHLIRIESRQLFGRLRAERHGSSQSGSNRTVLDEDYQRKQDLSRPGLIIDRSRYATVVRGNASEDTASRGGPGNNRASFLSGNGWRCLRVGSRSEPPADPSQPVLSGNLGLIDLPLRDRDVLLRIYRILVLIPSCIPLGCILPIASTAELGGAGDGNRASFDEPGIADRVDTESDAREVDNLDNSN